MGQSNKALHEKYEFRDIRRDEIEQAVRIEAICFPPNEACTYEHMAPRIENAPDLFLVAVDSKTGKMAAFLNGLATNREHLTDDFLRMLTCMIRLEQTLCSLDWMCCRSTNTRDWQEN